MKKLFVLILFLFLVQLANAQLILRFAEYKYKVLNYPDAIPFYKYYITKKDTNDLVSIRHLAECYRLTNQYIEAEKLYAKLIIKDTVYMDRLHYENAKQRNRKLIIPTDTINIKINRLAFNSEISDFAPSIYQQKLVFTSSKRMMPFIQRNHTWTETNFLSLQISDDKDSYSSYEPFAKFLRAKFNFGPATFLERDSIMYYTSNNPKLKSKKNGYVNLRIESAEYFYGKWFKTDKFIFNSLDYACAHPSINKTGTKLYFSSNMPGGYGGMDIYVCELQNESTWSVPKNLGADINSNKEEVFPFISDDNKLYFASNGKGSFGGLDIYMADLSKPNSKTNQLPAPINSSDDDFALITYPNSNKGFFSSNRENKGIDDDIYSFEIRSKSINIIVIDSISRKRIVLAQLKIKNKDTLIYRLTDKTPIEIRISPGDYYVFDVSVDGYEYKTVSKTFSLSDSIFSIEMIRTLKNCNVTGLVTKKETEEILDSVLVRIYNYNTKEFVYTALTNSLGYYKMFDLNSNTSYGISFSKAGYFTKGLIFNTTDEFCSRNYFSEYDYIQNIELDPIFIGKAIKIENIYFDVAKWNIRTDAAIELDKIVKMLVDNPEIIIELSSHTDSRASAKYNEQLSDKRAKSSATYITSKGIDENRINGKGYGEYMLINKCADGIKCSEKEHQQNRRTEFKVIGFVE